MTRLQQAILAALDRSGARLQRVPLTVSRFNVYPDPLPHRINRRTWQPLVEAGLIVQRQLADDDRTGWANDRTVYILASRAAEFGSASRVIIRLKT